MHTHTHTYMQLLPWSMLLLLVGSIIAARFYSWPTSDADCPSRCSSSFRCSPHWGVPKYASISGYMRDTLHWLPIRQRIFYRVAVLVWHCLILSLTQFT